MLTLVHATLFLSFDEPYHGNTKPNYIAYPSCQRHADDQRRTFGATGGQAMARRLRLVPGPGMTDRRRICPLTSLSRACRRRSGRCPLQVPLARNQGRRPPRIAGPSPGTAIWLLSCATDNLEVLGCHKVPVTTVASPYHGPSMRGLGFRCERQKGPAQLTLPHTTPGA